MKKQPRPPSIYVVQPWSCRHRRTTSQIEAYSVASGQREIIAATFTAAGKTSRELAEFIIATINAAEQREYVIDEMRAALKLCLETGKLTWAAEHDAELALRRASRGRS